MHVFEAMRGTAFQYQSNLTPTKVVTGWGCDMHAEYVSIRCFSGVYEHFLEQNTERVPCAYCTVGERGISHKRVL